VDTTWGDDPLPFVDGAFDLVYASHVLEHVPWFQAAFAASEAFRVLAPGGKLEVWVPDFAYLVDCYRIGICGDDWRKHNEKNDPMTWLNGRLFTYGGPGGLGDPNWHRSAWDWGSLHNLFREAGFADIERLAKPRGHDHGPINIGISGRKP
jgi:SAM-dependent methyltransferase